MNFEIDPREINLQGPDGMQLVKLLRGLIAAIDGGGDEPVPGEDSEFFYCTYGTTTYTEIQNALAEDKFPVCIRNGLYYYLVNTTQNRYVFACYNPTNNYLYAVRCLTDRWDNVTFMLQERLSWDYTPTQGSTRPVTSGGVWTALQNAGGSDIDPYQQYPAMDGDASPGSSDDYARGDHVHPTDTSRAAVSDIPTKVSDLQNDSGFVNANQAANASPVQSVNGQTGNVTVQPASDAQVKNAVDAWLGDNITQETGYVLDSSLMAKNAAAPAYNTGKIKNNVDEALNPERKLGNLCTGIEKESYWVAWNNGDTVVRTPYAGYMSALVPLRGAEYITLNRGWDGNSFSFFADANYKRIGFMRDYAYNSINYVYEVPVGAAYALISQNIANPPYNNEIDTKGVVVLEGNTTIDNLVTIADYPYGSFYGTYFYADNLRLHSLGDEKLSELVGATTKVYTCLKDGTGDFNSFVEAVTTLVEKNNAILFVGAGTWNIIDELGTTYMDAVSSSSSTWGLVLKNNIHIIGSSNSVITAKYSGSNNNVKTYFSAFNAGYGGFTIENLNIESDNIRYTVHDDRGGSGGEGYRNRYINCSMKHTNGMYTDCIGGGLGTNGIIEIINCYFEGDANATRLVYYHGNNFSGQTDAQCKLIVKGNYFAGIGTFGLTKYGDSVKVSTAYVSDNSVGSALFVNSGSYAPQNNMQMIEWNNIVRT